MSMWQNSGWLSRIGRIVIGSSGGANQMDEDVSSNLRMVTG